MPAATPAASIKLSASSTCPNSAKWTLAPRLQARKIVASPGPGKYVPRDDHRPRHPTFSFGSAAKLRDFSGTKLPGPGSYTPVDPTILVKPAAFTSSDRLPKRRDKVGPEPGQYVNSKNSSTITTNSGWSWGGRHQSTKFVTPGPGTYMPQPNSLVHRERTALIESGPNRDPFNGKRASPGPGKYESHADFGKHSSTTRSHPSFSMQSSRRPEPRRDVSAGPVLSHYSSFG